MNRAARAARWGWVVLMLLLTACAPMRPQRPVGAALPGEAAQALRCVDRWSLRGRAAFRIPGSSGSFRLNWQQQGDRYRLALEGPLGAGAMRIEGDAAEVVVESKGERRVYAAAPELVLAQILGYELPLQSLRYWVLGLSDPHVGPATWGFVGAETGEPVLRQAGWTVRYEEWSPSLSPVFLPARLILEREDIFLRVLIEHWDLDPTQLCPVGRS